MKKLALVTGTSSGLGAAVADLLLDRNWQIVGLSRRRAAIEHPRYRHVAADLQDPAASLRSIADAVEGLLADPRVVRVGLVNNAASGGLLVPFDRIDAEALLRMYAVNVAAPVALMGWIVERAHADAILRIVNVSSAAAVRAIPGLAAYSSSKAALRMAGMVLAAELESPKRPGVRHPDAAILSYEPGAVDTDMQRSARSLSPDVFPWVGMFRRFQEEGMLAPPAAPASEIVAFLEGDNLPRFTEARFGV